MRFIADAMLGRLARWLRILGHDTLYQAHIEDGALLRTGKEQGRIILTRDTRLIAGKTAPGQSFLVSGDDPLEQLREVADEFKLKVLQSLCPRCGGRLEKLKTREEARDSVPEHVFLKTKEFFRCRDCGHIYWEGTQAKKMKIRLGVIMDEKKDVH